MLENLILRNRSYRKFQEDERISEGVLKELVNLARFSPSGLNLQPFKFALISEKEIGNLIFPNLKWAGYLKDWNGPEEGERPSAYIIILRDKTLINSPTMQIDMGIACQSILLGAVEREYGGCIIASINKDGIRNAINISENYEIQLVIALGKPKQKIILEDLEISNDIKYWVDENGNHHVPKRKLEDIII